MHSARIAGLLQPYLGCENNQRLTADDLDNISTYVDILQRWNARINLTAVRDEDEIITRHFGESLFAARHLFPNRVGTGDSPVQPRRTEARTSHMGGHDRAPATLQGPRQAARTELTAGDQRSTTSPRIRLADLGSGAGFPGVPIKLWAPGISLTLIESNHKKATFLREVTRALTLTDVDIQDTRAESLAAASFDVVTLRAVERFESILPIAASLVAPRGRLALLISQVQLAQAKTTLPSAIWQPSQPVPESLSRVLAIATLP